MNPMLSEALGSIVRSILKIGAGYLVARGVWSQADATTYVAAGALAIVGLGWSWWTQYESRLKLVTSLANPTLKTEDQVVAHINMGAQVPTVTTPTNTVPGVPKVAMIVLALMLGTLPLIGCVHAPPTITTAEGQRAYTADQLVKDITALSETAINLNAAVGREHLSDANTRVVRDFAISVGPAAQSYALGQGTLQAIVSGWSKLILGLNAEAKSNVTFQRALMVVTAGVNALEAQGGR